MLAGLLLTLSLTLKSFRLGGVQLLVSGGPVFVLKVVFDGLGQVELTDLALAYPLLVDVLTDDSAT